MSYHTMWINHHLAIWFAVIVQLHPVSSLGVVDLDISNGIVPGQGQVISCWAMQYSKLPNIV